MYVYDEFDRTFIAERAAQFRDQVARRLSGEVTEDEFKPLRLMNGVYLQLHAYMLRIAIPYGTLFSNQLRKIAEIGRVYDRGYGHFTTRQNIQFNWIKLSDMPDVLVSLAEAGLHAIQTSGNCIRNITTDQWAGVAPDEIEDPRFWAEVLRQWSSMHPEFTFLPRKFKIAITAAPHDRAAIKVHDVGLRLVLNDAGEVGFQVLVGGGLGRSPFIGKLLRDFLPKEHLISYLEAILRTYNAHGRRDNIYKARIKILVHEIGVEKLKADVEKEWERIRDGYLKLDDAFLADIRSRFIYPDYEALEDQPEALKQALAADARFATWHRNSVAPHKTPGYGIVTVSLKPIGKPPGDATSGQLDALADLADTYSAGEIRVGHEQNLVLPHVRQHDLYALWQKLDAAGLATPNVNLISDSITCPGLDYCSLANARSIPIATAIAERFADHDKARSVGRLHLNISGCINACGHHHVGHIGILGVEKNDREFYQITLGGKADEDARFGDLLGPAIPYEEVVDTIERIVNRYLDLRQSETELFVDTVKRLGVEPFKEALHAVH
ncbi:nitrite/sulfite reductase [Rhodomicrobium vannielii ATCC 17100]|uniref:nitrite/sulfite reductase n=1 Tax=Rhodomicrobium vannielii TaxID=1069 RepID=UPI00191826AC|nr:nitrite/sulfite reductase [Rhodomicrobium vannielii]MBJ7534186.1 nitrite/sulfite reductase [Rhodomicrobium vannielii ATCC 17100]